MAGDCARCIVNVNGTPNVRACITPVANGMVVKSQKGWPTVNHDFLSFLLSRINLPSGFYYSHGAATWPILSRVYKRLTGLGKLPEAHSNVSYSLKTVEVDVAIVGGGMAGLSATKAIQRWGYRSALIEKMPWLGGNLALSEDIDVNLPREGHTSSSGQFMKNIALGPRTEVYSRTRAFGYYPPSNLLAHALEYQLVEFKARSFIIATGGYENLPCVPNNDLPGVLSYRAALILLNKHQIKPGVHGVIVGKGEFGSMVQKEFMKSGVAFDWVDEVGVVGFEGSKTIRGVRCRDKGSEVLIPADFVVIASGIHPAYELAIQAGASLAYSPGEGGLRVMHDENMKAAENVFVAGRVAGSTGPKDSQVQGDIASLSALYEITQIEKIRQERDSMKRP